jgi:hypothetical protein
MDSFLILGHGVESAVDFEERNKIPKGIVLVTIAECGIITTKEDVCPMVEAFTKPEYRDLLANPKENRKEIEGLLNGKPIHIFEEGDSYPTLALQMFLDWSHNSHISVFKSGLYKFPVSKEVMKLSDNPTFCESLYTRFGAYKGFSQILPDDFQAEQMYKGSLFPTVSEIETTMNAVQKRSAALKSSVTVPLETLFEKGGPGVYYYVVCRHPKNVKTPENLVRNYLQLAEGTNERYKPYYNKNWVSKLNTLIPILEANRNASTGWVRMEVEAALRNYRKLQRVPAIRRKSIVQQEGKGRSTRKQKRKQKRLTRRRFAGTSNPR